MKKIKEMSEVHQIIKNQPVVLLYIGQHHCSVCHSLKPQVSNIVKEFQDITMIEIDALETPRVAEAFDVLTVPVILLFIEGKEYLRRARMINTVAFKNDVSKIIHSYQNMVGNK